MHRGLATLALIAGACGRDKGVPDEQLGGLVVEVKPNATAIDLERAGKDPAELGRALLRPHAVAVAALGPHTLKLKTTSAVTEHGKPVSALDDDTTLELGEQGAFHGVYTNTAEYGRETIFLGGTLYLRPRYQKWHARAPEAPDEPAALRDQFAGAIAAVWDLLAPGAELTDRGAVQVAGRAGRRIEVKLAPAPAAPPAEKLAQRKWRETRSIDALAGEVVLDADKGVPLVVKLTGSVGFTRDGRRFSMALGIDGAVSAVGTVAAITAPAAAEVVATPERAREVDDRDFLLQGIAPPLRRNSDGTAATPQPAPTPTPKKATP